MDQRLPDPAGAAPPNWRGLCEELVRELHGYASANPHHDSDALVARARAALAQPEPEVVGPSLEEVEDLCEEHCFNVEGYESIECLQGLINDALTRWGRPALASAEEVEA